jgi:hypothetical protein
LREGTSLKLSDNKELGRIFGQKSEEVKEPWTKLDNEKLHYLHFSSMRE